MFPQKKISNAKYRSKLRSRSNPAMILNLLNDDCLLMILEKIPLRQLIPLRAVCRSWKYLIERRIGPSVKVLRLGHPRGFSFNEYELPILNSQCEYSHCLQTFYSIHLCKYRAPVVRFLGRLFPNIKTLVLLDFNEWNWRSRPTFLLCWPTLSTLLLLNWIYSDVWSRHLPSYAKSFESLRHLALLGPYLNPIATMPALQNLEQLTIFNLNELSTGPIMFPFNLRRLCVYQTRFSNFEFSEALRFNPEFMTRLTDLTISKCLVVRPIETSYINLICSNLPQLKFIDLTFSNGTLNEVVFILRKLRYLTELRLRFGMNSPQDLFQNWDSIGSRREIMKLPSVTNLHLDLWINANNVSLIQQVFPNIEELHLNKIKIEYATLAKFDSAKICSSSTATMWHLHFERHQRFS